MTTEATETGTADVLASGGVVLRRTAKGRIKVLVVHRPHRRDWSLPKGKLDPGESFEEAAVREVEEETSVRCRLVRELRSVRYEDRRGREKLVRYWLMEPVGTHRIDHPGDTEIDEVRWMRVDEAVAMLTYDSDRHLIDDALEELA